MTVHELEILSAIHKEKNASLLLRMKKELLTNTEAIALYNYFEDYIRNNKVFPELGSIREKFVGLTLPTTDKDSYHLLDSYIQEVSRERLVVQLRNAALSLQHPDVPLKEVISGMVRELNSSPVLSNGDKVSDLKLLMDQVYETILKRNSNNPWDKDKLDNFGFPGLDRLGPGIEPGNLIVIHARTGVGKTWLMLMLAKEFWKKLNHNPLVVSLEMNEEEIGKRFAAIASGVSYGRMMRGELFNEEIDKLTKFKDNVKKSSRRLLVTCPYPCTQNTIQGLIETQKPTIVFVDYASLMRDARKGKGITEELGHIANDLKGLAEFYKIPIVLLAQSNRDSVGLSPKTENIKDADSLGAAANIVVALFQSDDMEQAKQMQISITKYRNGQKGKVLIDFDLEEMKLGTEVQEQEVPKRA